jgi:hypothetical protein
MNQVSLLYKKKKPLVKEKMAGAKKPVQDPGFSITGA